MPNPNKQTSTSRQEAAGGDSTTLAFNCPNEMVKRIKDTAAQTDRSVSSIIRVALNYAFANAHKAGLAVR